MDILPSTKQKDSSFDKILSYYMDKSKVVRLTPKQELVRLRWEAAFSLLCNYRSAEQAIPLLQEQFKDDEGNPLSRAQAYRDIRNAKNMFGDINTSSKEGDRYILYELAMKTFQIAAKNHDTAEMNRSIANMIKIKGLDKDDPDLPSFDKIQPPIQILNVTNVFMEKYKGILPADIMKQAKSIKFTELRTTAEEREEEESEEYEEDEN